MNVTQTVKSAALLILMAASLPALGDSKMFLVDMRILQDGAELATPSMVIKEGADASMSLTGDQPVSLALTVTGAGESDAHILAEVETAMGKMSPELLMRKDQWGSISTGGLEFHIRVQEHIEGQSQP